MVITLFYCYMLIVGASIHEIDKLKKKLLEEFAMKGLGVAKQILRMKITKGRKVLKLSQEEYVKKVLSKFNMVEAKLVNTLLASHFRPSKDQLASTEQEQVYMAIPYVSTIGSYIYIYIYICHDLH